MDKSCTIVAIRAQERHDVVAVHLLEWLIQAFAYLCGSSAQRLTSVVSSHAGLADDDLSSFQREGDLAARQKAGSIAQAFGDRNLSFVSNLHILGSQKVRIPSWNSTAA